MHELSFSTIDMIERSIELDTFEKRSNKSRVSDSFIEIFMFFKQTFDFITSLNTQQEYIKDKLLFFMSLNAALCSYYVESLLSLASGRFRSLIDNQQKNVSLKKKSSFPSWCPERESKSTNLECENRSKWLKHVSIYEKYLPNQPQVLAAVKATTRRRTMKEKNDESPVLVLNDADEAGELTGNYSNFNVKGDESIKDPCYKISIKVNFMLNFLSFFFEIIKILDYTTSCKFL